MKKKIFKFFTAMSVLGIAASLASCGDNNSQNTTPNTGPSKSTNNPTQATTKPSDDVSESEVYYCDSLKGQYLFTKFGKNFTLSILGNTYTGICTVENDKYTLTSNDLVDCTANYVDGQLVLKYQGNSYNFYKMVSHLVTFNDGTTSNTAYVLNGKKATKRLNPTKDKEVFVGWYKDKEFKDKFDFEKELVTSDLTLYARFVSVSAGVDEYNVSFLDGDTELFAAQKTIGGVVYDLPTPESTDKKKFLGWWVSDFNDSNKLTHQYNGEKLTKDSVLFAVWDDGNLHASVDENGVSWNSLGANKTYYVRIKDPSGNVYSESSQSVQHSYKFNLFDAGVYEINVSCDGKESVVYFANKSLATVSGYFVVGNILVFNPVENAKGYKIKVECGNDNHDEEEYDLGNNTYFDFSNCQMKKGGIKFTVEAYSLDYGTSIASTYILDRTLDKVENATVSDSDFVWSRVSNATGYVVEVEHDNTKDVFNLGNVTSFSLKEYTGKLKLSVYPVSNGYNSLEATTVEYEKKVLASPKNIKSDGLTITWDEVLGASSYVLKVGDVEYTTDTNSFVLSADSFNAGENYRVEVMALSSDSNMNSYYSDPIEFNYLGLSDLSYANGVLSWNTVLGASKYEVKVNGKVYNVDGDINFFNVSFTKSGDNVLEVSFFDADGKKYPSVKIVVKAYKVQFEACTGNSMYTLPNRYFALGDNLVLPTASKDGYVFDGWYNVPDGKKENGMLYTESDNMPSQTLVLYANWKAQTYTVTLDCGENATLDMTTANVDYMESFVLPVPSRTKADNLTFDGWYTSLGGNGVKITSASGASVSGWNYMNNITLYANWVNALDYKEVKKGNKVVGYKAVPGVDLRGIDEITIPSQYNGLPVIELGSFAGCGNLVKINVPNTLSYIDTVTGFANCTNLEALNVYEVSDYTGEVLYTSYDGVLYYNNQVSVTSGWEVRFVPKALTGECEIMPGTVSITLKAFYGSKVSSVKIPYTVKTIEEEAFYYSNKLESIEFEATPYNEKEVELTISSRAFANCRNLVNVTLPKRLVSLANGVEEGKTINSFDSCEKLVNINVENGNKAYTSIDGLLYDNTKSALLLVGAGRKGDLTLKIGLLRISDYAASNCKYLTSVKIPASVLYVGENAFYQCKNIKSVEFEDENEETLTISKNAFYGCAFTYVELPHNARVVMENAFAANDKLNTIKVNSDDANGNLVFANGINGSSNVAKVIIGKDAATFDVKGAFGSTLKSVVVEEGNKFYSSDDNGVLYNANKTKLIFFPSVNVDKFIVPESVLELASGCFAGNTSLKTVVLNKNLKSIGAEAFLNCSNLSSVTFEDGRDEALEFTISDKAFKNCTSINEFILPSGTVSLGESCFENCSSLGSMELPEGVESIGDKAFNNCVSLQKFVIPQSLTTFGSYDGSDDSTINCFLGCTRIKLTVSNNNSTFVEKDGILYLKEDGVAKVLCYAPNSVSGDIVIPKTVNKIVPCAFFNCINSYGNECGNTKIKSISFEDGKSAVYTENGVEKEGILVVGKRAFADCTSLVSVSLPNLEVIEEKLFKGCKKLESFTVANTVKTIKSGAFMQCCNYYNNDKWYPNKQLNLEFEEGNDDLPLVIEDNSSQYDATFYGAKIRKVTFPKRLTKIGDSAFYYCTALAEVNINANCVTIGKNAFNSASKLATVTFEEGSKLESIGNYAFSYTVLNAIDLPNTVHSVGTSVFSSSNLTSFKVPSSLTAIPASLFSGCKNLASVDFGDAKITEINKNAFKGCKALTSVTIPSTVSILGESVFENAGLTEVVFADNSHLSVIGNNAFAGSNLTSFKFPKVYELDGTDAVLQSLGSNLFANCNNLVEITLTSSVDNITNLLVNNTSIESIKLEGNDKFYVDEESSIIYNKDKTKLFYAFGNNLSGDVVIPDGVEFIAANAFACKEEITSVKFPQSLLELGENAFKDCISLKEVKFADNCKLSAVGKKVFSSCESLVSVSLPSNLKEISGGMFENCSLLQSVSSNAESIGDEAFINCITLSDISYSKDITYIGCDSFGYCESLTSINLYKNVELGVMAFENCSGLSNVVIENGFDSLTDQVFNGCSSLESITLPDSVTSVGYSCFGGTKIKELVLPKNVTDLGVEAFSGLETLVNVTIEGQLVSIPMNAFSGCTGLEKVVLPNSLQFIEYGAFSGCKSLKSIELPNSLESISGYAFYQSGLEKVVLPENLTQLGQESDDSESPFSVPSSVFGNCSELSEVVFNCTNLERIEGQTFSGCTSLKSIALPASIKYVGSNAFSGSGLVDVNIAGVTEIGSALFYNCKDLENVYFSPLLEILPKSTFEGCEKLSEVELPIAVSELGDNAFKNTGITSVKLDNIQVIGSNVFADCSKLTKFVVDSNNLTVIPAGMFNGCTNLTEVRLSDSLEVIESGAFAGTGVTSFTLPASLVELGDSAFKDCKALATVDFSNNNALISLGDSVFEGCDLLTSITLPNSVTMIGSYAFKDSGLTSKFTIGKNVSKIGNNPFMGLNNLKIDLDSANKNFYLDETNSLYSSKNDLIVVNKDISGEFVIASDVNVLDDAFYGCNGITKLTLSEGVSTIKESQYAGIGQITEVVLPSTLTEIGDYAFSNNEKLISVSIPTSVENLGSGVFKNCTSLETVNLSNTLEISNNLFENCSSLKAVNFVLDGDVSLSIGDYAFSGCTSLVSFTGDKVMTIDKTFNHIGQNAFNNTGVESLVFDTSLDWMCGDSAFGDCKNLKNVLFTENAEIGDYTVELFKGCKSLTNVVFKDGVKYLGTRTFSGCTSLKSVTLPNDIVSLGTAFSNSAIESIVIPASVETIDANAFDGCKNLASLKFEGNISSIGYEAFKNCTGLKKLVIPSENLYDYDSYYSFGIDSGVFTGWGSDQTVYFTLDEASMKNRIDQYAFEGSNANVVYNYKLS